MRGSRRVEYPVSKQTLSERWPGFVSRVGKGIKPGMSLLSTTICREGNPGSSREVPPEKFLLKLRPQSKTDGVTT